MSGLGYERVQVQVKVLEEVEEVEEVLEDKDLCVEVEVEVEEQTGEQ